VGIVINVVQNLENKVRLFNVTYVEYGCMRCVRDLVLISIMCYYSDCDELHSRLEKVEAKLVQEVGSGLETHRKIIESIPSSASAVEFKLKKVAQELGTKLDSHYKTIKTLPTNVPAMIL